MRMLKLLVLAVLSSSILLAGPQPNGLMTANAGTRFSLSGPDANGVLTHTVNGVAQVSVIGNCLVRFDVFARPQPPGVPWEIEGTMHFTYPNDGSILRLKVKGSVLPDPNVPIAEFHYDAEIISGEGQFAGARGQGQINGAALFIDDQGNGTATWTYRGHIFTRPAK